MTAQRLLELIELAGYEYCSYSGRGMFGVSCVGVVCDSVQSLMSDLMHVCEREDIEALFQYRTDDMGKSTIIYWHSVTL